MIGIVPVPNLRAGKCRRHA